MNAEKYSVCYDLWRIKLKNEDIDVEKKTAMNESFFVSIYFKTVILKPNHLLKIKILEMTINNIYNIFSKMVFYTKYIIFDSSIQLIYFQHKVYIFWPTGSLFNITGKFTI